VIERLELASLEQAFAWLDGLGFPTATATVEPSRAVGRTLLFELRAASGLPPQDRASIAGVAVAARQTEGAGPYNPLPVSGVSVQAGEAMPARCDAVMPADLIEAGHALEAVAPGEFVTGAESQLRRGALVFEAGHRLRPHDVPVLVELGVKLVTVRFGLMVTGDTPEHLDELEIALLWRDYAQWDDEGDLVLTTHDLPGDRWDITGVALRPGGACQMGWRDGKPALKLPDEPLAFTLAYEIFVSRLLRRVARLGPACRTAKLALAGKIVSTIGYTDLALVRVEKGSAWPLPGIDTGGAAALARADGYVVVPPTREGFGVGDEVVVHLFAGQA
jgi:molybdopterin molybdotransferase